MAMIVEQDSFGAPTRWVALLGFTLILWACAADAPPGEGSRAPSKEEAAATGGVDAEGFDLCQLYGWYDDEVCDSFCPEPDPDCADAGDAGDAGIADTGADEPLDGGADSDGGAGPDGSDGAGGGPDGAGDTGLGDGVDGSDADLPSFRSCIGRDFAPTFSDEWEHPVISGTIALASPGHSIEDLVFTWHEETAGALQVEGKFAYGSISKDLEDEWVQAYADDCQGWVDLGLGLTDSDGRVRFAMSPALLAQPGRYEVRMVVQGDGSTARGYVLVVPPGSQFVVFDIDGTLTTGDDELALEVFTELFGGDYVPDAYDGALDIVAAYRAQGYEIIYLTGRPYWLSHVTRGWLEDLGFPLGTMHLTRDLGQTLPSEDGVGNYKRDYLRSILVDHHILRAYGNAETDIYGYREAGIALDDVYIIGDNAGASGTQAVDNYPDHLGDIEIPDAEQPFRR
jgi:hypothetical protein